MMPAVSIYTTRFCPYCVQAKRLLGSKGVQYDEIAVDGDSALRQKMMTLSGRHTVPQIWVGQTHVGGFEDSDGGASASLLGTIHAAGELSVFTL